MNTELRRLESVGVHGFRAWPIVHPGMTVVVIGNND
jgi:hypothetical protein